jgi:hypothetical protein
MFLPVVVIFMATVCVFGVDLAHFTSASQESPASSKNGANVTTECISFGPDSESESIAKLLSDGRNVTQQCEQDMKSAEGSQFASNQYADSDKSSSNQVNQQSEQKIGN